MAKAIVNKKISLIENCEQIRAVFSDYEAGLKELQNHADLTRDGKDEANKGEAVANIQIAFRHLQDARMRLGEVMNAMGKPKADYSKTK